MSGQAGSVGDMFAPIQEAPDVEPFPSAGSLTDRRWWQTPLFVVAPARGRIRLDRSQKNGMALAR